MLGFRMALAAACCVAAGAATAQDARRFLANSSLTFHEYFEPFPRVGSAAACRSHCASHGRCSGWTWYRNLPQFDPVLRHACILGAGLKDSQIGNRAGRTSGFIAGR